MESQEFILLTLSQTLSSFPKGGKMIREIVVSSIVHLLKNTVVKNPIVAKKPDVEIGPYKGTNIGFGCNLRMKNGNG